MIEPIFSSSCGEGREAIGTEASRSPGIDSLSQKDFIDPPIQQSFMLILR